MQQGQASLEYVALVLVAGVVLAGAGTAVASTGVAAGVRTQMARALCIVSGGDCDRDRSPCPTHTHAEKTGGSVSIAFLRLGRHHGLLREERSDGTVALTLLEQREGGGEASQGVKAVLELGDSQVAVGGEITASALVRLGTGSTWVVPAADAAALQRKLRWHFHTAPAKDLALGFLAKRVLPTLPRPDETFGDAGLEVSGGASIGGADLAGDALIAAEDTFGSRVNRVSGRRTSYIRRRNTLTGSLGDVSSGGTAKAEYALTVDRTGRPIDFVVIRTGTLNSPDDLPSELRPAAGLLNVASEGDRTWVSESHLDLSEPDNLAVARDVIRQLRSPRPRMGDVVAVSDALAARLRDRAVVHARSYTLDGKRYGGQLGGRVHGIGVGGSASSGTETAKLIAASTRGLDGEWRTREDCIDA